MTATRTQRTLFATTLATSFAAALSACGGGGVDAPLGGNTSNETAQSASANGVVIADDSVRAQTAVLSAARTVIAVGGASASVTCAGGGSASFTATGPLLGNGQLDAGEVYTMQFVNCRSSTGSATVTGSLTLTVNSASGENYVVSTSANVVVGLPQRTLSHNGASTISHTVQTSGATQTTTDRWQSPSISTSSLRNNRLTTLSLTNVDLTQTVVTTGGVVTGSSNQGTVTMTYAGWLGTWSATVATQGVVNFNANGVPINGQWLITLPRDLILLSVVPGNPAAVATASLDFGRNGSIDRTLSWLVPALMIEAD